MLAGLASAYVDAINKGAVPTISTAWQVSTAYFTAQSSYSFYVTNIPEGQMLFWLSVDFLPHQVWVDATIGRLK